MSRASVELDGITYQFLQKDDGYIIRRTSDEMESLSVYQTPQDAYTAIEFNSVDWIEPPPIKEKD